MKAHCSPCQGGQPAKACKFAISALFLINLTSEMPVFGKSSSQIPRLPSTGRLPGAGTHTGVHCLPQLKCIVWGNTHNKMQQEDNPCPSPLWSPPSLLLTEEKSGLQHLNQTRVEKCSSESQQPE